MSLIFVLMGFNFFCDDGLSRTEQFYVIQDLEWRLRTCKSGLNPNPALGEF